MQRYIWLLFIFVACGNSADRSVDAAGIPDAKEDVAGIANDADGSASLSAIDEAIQNQVLQYKIESIVHTETIPELHPAYCGFIARHELKLYTDKTLGLELPQGLKKHLVVPVFEEKGAPKTLKILLKAGEEEPGKYRWAYVHAGDVVRNALNTDMHKDRLRADAAHAAEAARPLKFTSSVSRLCKDADLPGAQRKEALKNPIFAAKNN